MTVERAGKGKFLSHSTLQASHSILQSVWGRERGFALLWPGKFLVTVIFMPKED